MPNPSCIFWRLVRESARPLQAWNTQYRTSVEILKSKGLRVKAPPHPSDHSTSSPSQALVNVRKLLDAGGRFLLHGLHSVNKLPNYAFGQYSSRMVVGYSRRSVRYTLCFPCAMGVGARGSWVHWPRERLFVSKEPDQLNAIMVAKLSVEPVSRRRSPLQRRREPKGSADPAT